MQNGGGEKSRAQEKEGTQIFDRFSNFINNCSFLRNDDRICFYSTPTG